jgi:hypothetical protein
MEFYEFLKLLEKNDEDYYLSTQSIEDDENGLPNTLFVSPLSILVFTISIFFRFFFVIWSEFLNLILFLFNLS